MLLEAQQKQNELEKLLQINKIYVNKFNKIGIKEKRAAILEAQIKQGPQDVMVLQRTEKEAISEERILQMQTEMLLKGIVAFTAFVFCSICFNLIFCQTCFKKAKPIGNTIATIAESTHGTNGTVDVELCEGKLEEINY